MKKLFVCLSLVVFVLSGCGKKNVKPAEYTAEEAALAYFESIYNTKNFKRALTLASPKLQRLMKSYHTPKGVARHIINLRYDSQVQIKIDGGNSIGRAEFASKQVVSIFFTGTYYGDKIDELRTVHMVRNKGAWVVDSILADKFL